MNCDTFCSHDFSERDTRRDLSCYGLHLVGASEVYNRILIDL